jgi:hypothetical protein
MIKYEIIASTGTYKSKTGEEKKRWLKCGVVMETKNGGLAMKLEAIPMGSDGWFTLTEPKEYEAKKDSGKEPRNIAEVDDDVPF